MPQLMPMPKLLLVHIRNIVTETREAKKEFSQIDEDENKRIQQVAEKENVCIIQKKRTNWTVKICPVCLDEFPAIESY